MSDTPLRLTIITRRVHPAHGPGGLERHVHDQVVHLSRAGIDITLWAEEPRDPERRRAAERVLGPFAELRWVPPGPLPIGVRKGTVVLDRVTNYPLWARRVARTIVDPGDIVHVHGLAGLGAAAAKRSGRWQMPLVLTTQGMEEFRASGLKHLAYAPFQAGMRRIAAAAERVIVTDRALMPTVQGPLGLDDGRVTLIPNAVDPDGCVAAADVDAASALLRDHGVEDAQPLLLSMGRLAPNKGFEVLAVALADVAKTLPSGWAWVLIGDGPTRSVIEATVTAGGAGGRSVLVGFVEESVKHGLLALADWFVHPTLYEGSSLVTLEAMAHGLPIVASRTGGLPDKIEDGRTGFLVPPGDRAALAAAISCALEADGPTMGAAGRRLLDERYSWRAATGRFLALYDELSGRC